MSIRTFAAFTLLVAAGLSSASASGWKLQERPAARVNLTRVPDGGLQPQVAVKDGTVHLIYFQGDAQGGDIYYVHLRGGVGGRLRVNSRPGSAIAIGTVRGAHLAVGKDQRVHVTWMGSERAAPRGPGGASPMLYSRLNDAGSAFEPQRNVMQYAVGLDGGGSVAADASGNVFVFWHAGGPDSKGEGDRRVWLARSQDNGRTFSREQAVSPAATGACGCCGARALADRRGDLFVLYRGAADLVHRDTHLLTSTDRGATFRADKIEEWNLGACPMSTFALADGPAGPIAAWETAGQIGMVRIDRDTRRRSAVMAPAPLDNLQPTQKHPAIATNAAGETILVWTEGTAWQRGGSVAWQIFDARGQAIGERGRAPGVPVWSLAAVYARPDGGFTILY